MTTQFLSGGRGRSKRRKGTGVPVWEEEKGEARRERGRGSEYHPEEKKEKGSGRDCIIGERDDL